MLDGVLKPGPSGGAIIAFERLIRRPAVQVWAALTVPERVADWLARAEIDLRLGGRYALSFHGGEDVMVGVITRIEPPRLLEFSWRENQGPAESRVLWELEPDGDACRLKLTHIFPPDAPDLEGFVSGWHVHLDDLAAGVPVPWEKARWAAIDAAYRDQRAPG